jgi:hypothetical protein
MWAISVIFIKLPKVNSHALGENSPNPVTLPALEYKNGPPSNFPVSELTAV